MLRLRAIALCAVSILLMSFSGGCVQGDNHLDEDKDPHFQRGRNLASGQDFKGAAAEFEKALETNPRSATAHFELGWLYDTKLNDFAAAIYHYDQHLKLQPDSERAALVKERIRGCKQQLANSEFPLPHSRDLQKDVDRLTAENNDLKQQVETLKHQLALASAPVAVREQPQPRVGDSRYVTPIPSPTRGGSNTRGRVHIVKSGETITSIASQYGVSKNAVLAANPQTNPRRLRVGQSINLP